jgi:hypothetical protein
MYHLFTPRIFQHCINSIFYTHNTATVKGTEFLPRIIKHLCSFGIDNKLFLQNPMKPFLVQSLLTAMQCFGEVLIVVNIARVYPQSHAD